jgi:hypothetical protein
LSKRISYMAEEKVLSRAPPRKAKKDPTEVPVFLQKSFQMVDSAPVHIAAWSPNGDSFYIKDQDKFTDLLPTFFKHRNMRSFVRQLNFYGFRKIRLADGVRPEEWWEFKHDKFSRGKPHLLALIKRADHYETGEEEQAAEKAAELQGEVSALRDQIDSMAGAIEQLTALVDSLLRERDTGVPCQLTRGVTSAAEALSKKRKVGAGGGGAPTGSLLATFSGHGDLGYDEALCRGGGGGSGEFDEADMFSQLSIDSSGSMDSLDGALDGGSHMSAPDELQGFDFSEGAIDERLLAPLVRSASSTSTALLGSVGSLGRVGSGGGNGDLAAFLAKLGGFDFDGPTEPHRAEGQPLMRSGLMRSGSLCAVNA